MMNSDASHPLSTLLICSCFLIAALAMVALAVLAIRAVVKPVSHPPVLTQPMVLTQPPDATWSSRPHPGDVWWAWIDFEDGSGRKHRPCLIIRTHADHVEALKITSQDKSHRWDHIEVSDTQAWDHKASKNSYLDISAPYWVWDANLDRRAGNIDPWVMAQVHRHHRCGWIIPPSVSAA